MMRAGNGLRRLGLLGELFLMIVGAPIVFILHGAYSFRNHWRDCMSCWIDEWRGEDNE